MMSAPHNRTGMAVKKNTQSKKRGPNAPRTGPKLFSVTVGTRPNSITVQERVIGGSIRLIFRIDGKRVGRRLRDARINGCPVDDLRVTRTRGVPNKKDVTAVRNVVSALAYLLYQGVDPWNGTAPIASPASTAAAPFQSAGNPKGTLGWLQDVALGTGGRFPGNARHMIAQRNNLARYLPRVVAKIGPSRKITELTKADLQAYWLEAAEKTRTMRERNAGVLATGAPHANVKHLTGWEGYRATEITLELLLTTINWARSQFRSDAHGVESSWRAAFKREWCNHLELYAHDRAARRSPRYSDAEIGAFLAGIEKGLGDARIRRAVDLGGEQRVGQLINNCWRRHLTLPDKAGQATLVINGQGNKGGVTLYLTDAQRGRVENDLRCGDLADLEAAYQAAEIYDYPLFPGRIDPQTKQYIGLHQLQPIHGRYAKRLFRDFEARCGVAHEEGRGWKAFRAWGSDAILEAGRALGASEAVINLAQGWHRDSSTSQRFYRAQNVAIEQQEAARIRDNARTKALKRVARDTGSPPESDAAVADTPQVVP